MTKFQSEKQVVRNLYQRLEMVCADQIETLLQSTVTDDYFWRGFHPFNEIRGGEAVANHFWAPLIPALTSMQRRMDIFFAGVNSLDGLEGVWVVSMGHLMGLFDEAWLGIQPTGKMVMLRYCECNRLADDKIIQESKGRVEILMGLLHMDNGVIRQETPTKCQSHSQEVLNVP